MSSVLSAFASSSAPPTKFFDILTGGYNENVIVDGYGLPIPFVVTNQVLDINVNQSTDVQAFVANGSTPGNNINFQGKVMGGASLVKSFGPNMTDWLRNHINSVESLGDPYSGQLVLYVRPFMTKVQIVDPIQGLGALNDESVYGITLEPPTSTEYIGGDLTNNFFTAWVFKTPMTIQYFIGGAAKYLTMTSQFSAN
jgi:hypothetical protein